MKRKGSYSEGNKRIKNGTHYPSDIMKNLPATEAQIQRQQCLNPEDCKETHKK